MPPELKSACMLSHSTISHAVRRGAGDLEMHLAVADVRPLVGAIGGDQRLAGLGERVIQRVPDRRRAETERAVRVHREAVLPDAHEVEVEADQRHGRRHVVLVGGDERRRPAAHVRQRAGHCGAEGVVGGVGLRLSLRSAEERSHHNGGDHELHLHFRLLSGGTRMFMRSLHVVDATGLHPEKYHA